LAFSLSGSRRGAAEKGGQALVRQKQADRFGRGKRLVSRLFVMVDGRQIAPIDWLPALWAEMELGHLRVPIAFDQFADKRHFGLKRHRGTLRHQKD
jgi:hypothetical protein